MDVLSLLFSRLLEKDGNPVNRLYAFILFYGSTMIFNLEVACPEVWLRCGSISLA